MGHGEDGTGVYQDFAPFPDVASSRELEPLVRAFLDGIPGLLITAAPAGDFEFFNGPALEFFGKTPEELRTWTTSGIVYPDDLPALS